MAEEVQGSRVSSGGSIPKKKAKKKKRKGKNEQDSNSQTEEMESFPKQVSDHAEPVLTDTKCTRCGKTIRQLVRGVRNPETSSIPFICDVCVKGMSKAHIDERKGVGDNYGLSQRSLKETQCNCAACVSKRENAVPPEVERDAHITQSYWMEIRHIVRCIYRDSMNLADHASRENIGSEKMRNIVKKLCSRDPHQFFQRLETLAREYLLEVKVRLLEQLSCGFNSPQLAIEFIQMLLDEYSTLCASLPALLYLLEPLEETDYVKRLGVTIELVNKNIFRELIFAESFMSSNLPLIIAQLKLASLSSDPFHRNTADNLSKRYVSLDKEMEEIGSVWKSAKDQLRNLQQEAKKREERRAHLERIKADGETFKKLKQEQQVHVAHAQECAVVPVTTLEVPPSTNTSIGTTEISTAASSTDKITSSDTENTESSSAVTEKVNEDEDILPVTTPTCKRTLEQRDDINPSQSSLSPSITNSTTLDKDSDTAGWLTKEQVAEFSRILFKCVRPIGEPEFRITDSIATHTIALKIDMTSIDLTRAEAICTEEQVHKYEQLGMRREEIAEVALKLSAIKHLGINLRIDDLFDEHGFKVMEGEREFEEKEDAVFFVKTGRNSLQGKEKLMQEELSRSTLVDLSSEKAKVIERELGEGRETDLLQSMTMKIRFMKSITSEEMRRKCLSDSEQVIFDSCDQVQMRLTQLELNTMRLMRANTCLAANLGVVGTSEKEAPTRTAEKCLETEAHQSFVGLLLEQKKQTVEIQQAKKKQQEAELKADEAQKDDAQEKQVSDDLISKEVESKSTNSVELASDEAKVPEQASSEVSITKSALCIPSQTQACQCFACIGAVAAQQTEDIARPLNPVHPSGCKLTINSTLTAELVQSYIHSPTEKDSATKVTSKSEHLWHNWMSTNDANELEEDTSLTETANDDNNTTETSSNASCTSNSGTESHTATTSSNGCTGSNNNGPVRRYCPCCYCELFGHNSVRCRKHNKKSKHKKPATAPTSHNYAKQRDKMRQKLEKKRQHLHCHHMDHVQHEDHQHEHSCPHPIHTLTKPVSTTAFQPVTVSPTPPLQQDVPVDSQESTVNKRSLDDLLRYIEGKDAAESSNKNKKKKNKKKVMEQGKHEDTGNKSGKSQEEAFSSGFKKDEKTEQGSTRPEHSVLHNGLNRKGALPSPPASPLSQRQGGKSATSPKSVRRKSKKPQHQSNGGLLDRSDKSTEALVLSDREEDYDQEVEEFKKVCFTSAPVDKKLHVSLNMKDIMSKIK